MFSIENSEFKEEIELFLKNGGTITTLPPEKAPGRSITARHKSNLEELSHSEISALDVMLACSNAL